MGKKDLPDITISIKWYYVSDDNEGHAISDELQEIVKREEEQIIGSYLKIQQVTLHQYGRYLCRVEMGNSQTHRLEMSAELINALPIEAGNESIFINPYFLASCAAVITVTLFFLLLRTQQWWTKHLITFHSNEMEIFNLKTKNLDLSPTIPKKKKSGLNRHNRLNEDTKIMIDVI